MGKFMWAHETQHANERTIAGNFRVVMSAKYTSGGRSRQLVACIEWKGKAPQWIYRAFSFPDCGGVCTGTNVPTIEHEKRPRKRNHLIESRTKNLIIMAIISSDLHCSCFFSVAFTPFCLWLALCSLFVVPLLFRRKTPSSRFISFSFSCHFRSFG